MVFDGSEFHYTSNKIMEFANLSLTNFKSVMEKQKLKEFSLEIIAQIKENQINSKKELNAAKIMLCEKFGFKEMPDNPTILAFASTQSKKAKQLLGIKAIRTLSGVAPLAIMSKPFPCPHGKCIPCPGGPKSFFGDIPQSYTGKEPATLRGIANDFDPYLQIFNRLSQYIAIGLNPEKVELIIMGGTFPSFPKEYQKKFVSDSFKALNDFGIFYKKDKLNVEKFNKFFEFPLPHSKQGMQKVKNKILKLKRKSELKIEQKKNEEAKIRLTAMCIETRPDYCREQHINEMLEFGATRVELGVQSIYNHVLEKIKRGHSVEDSILATQLLKDSALKVVHHYMLGLPDSNAKMDTEMLREIFENPDFKPDGLKIYPCLVLKGTELYNWWRKGKFKPLNTEQAAEIIAEAKPFFPKWTRVHRIMRDIPPKFAEAGVMKGNLREIAREKMVASGKKCNCIRCREAGIKGAKEKIVPETVKIFKEKYSASNGTEIFVSAEDEKKDLLAGFCRLRIPFKPFRKEITSNSALIRELHVFGPSVGLGKTDLESQQHKGFGKTLLNEAERIAIEEFDAKKILIISGIGVREYYKKLGYSLDGVYISKKI